MIKQTFQVGDLVDILPWDEVDDNEHLGIAECWWGEAVDNNPHQVIGFGESDTVTLYDTPYFWRIAALRKHYIPVLDDLI